MNDEKYIIQLKNVIKQHLAPVKDIPMFFLLEFFSSRQKKGLKRILSTNNRRLHSNKDSVKILAEGDC